MNYIFHLLIMIGIYLILTYSVNLILGFSGLMSLSAAAFYGIGAYSYTLLIMKFNIPFLLALLFAIIFTGFIAYLISFPALRFKGDVFVLTTLGFQIIIYSILYNWISLTRGPYGIPGIPKPHIFNMEITEIWQFLIFTIIFLIITVYVIFKIYNSPFGLALKSIRDNAIAAQSLGKPINKYLRLSFTISSALSAISGVLYATYVTYIDPTSFTLSESIFIISILMIGGSGNKKGPFLGTLLMILLPEALRYLGLPDAIAANLRQIIYGLLLIVLMFFRPQGLGGDYKIE